MKSTVFKADWLDQASGQIDMRLKHHSALSSTIVTRAQNLCGQDKSLVLAMYRDGHSGAEIARLGGHDPRQVRRRIKNALARLADPMFNFVITHKSQWSSTRRAVAQCLFQAGLSIRQTAEQLDLKIHQVRRHRAAIIEQFNSLPPSTTRTPDRTWRYPH